MEETLEELSPGGFRILQKRRGFRFGMEAVLLADFARISSDARVADLGTGTGILPLLLLERGKGSVFDALEVRKDMADMARRTMEMNRLSACVRIHCLSVEQGASVLAAGCMDAAVSNPPFYPPGAAAAHSADPARAAAMVQAPEGLMPWWREAARLIRFGGLLFAVLRPDLLPLHLADLHSCGLEPKRLQCVHAQPGSPAGMVLLEARRGGRPGLRIEPPLFTQAERKAEAT